MRKTNTIEKFMSLVEHGDDCWEFHWKPMRNRRGHEEKFYPEYKLNGKKWRTHRLAYFIEHGSIPEGAHIMHTCDNPWCCNPAHLVAGTNHDNVVDRHLKGRTRGATNTL